MMVTKADLDSHVGTDRVDAFEKLSAKFSDMRVVDVPMDAMVTADYRTDRLRIWFDPETNLVVDVVNG